MPLVVYDSYLNKNTLITKSYRTVLVERIKYITKVVLINIYSRLKKRLSMIFVIILKIYF